MSRTPLGGVEGAVRALACAAALLAGLPAAAEQRVLRVATIAPDGTAWARELKAFARGVLPDTGGQVEIKLYLGGIAGDDVQAAERIKRGQLDGVGSGGVLCDRLSPTMRAVHALADDRAAAAYALGRLRPVIEEEFRRSGYVYFGGFGLGPAAYYLRAPVKDFSDLRKVKLWVWDLDEVLTQQVPAIGLTSVPLPVAEASRAYDEGRVDGFIALPAAAQAFQWATQAPWVLDLRLGFISACLILADRAFDALSFEAREGLRAAAAKLFLRLEDVGRRQDEALLDGIIERQGLKRNALGPALRSAYRTARSGVWEKVSETILPKPVLDRVAKTLAEFEHGRTEAR